MYSGGPLDVSLCTSPSKPKGQMECKTALCNIIQLHHKIHFLEMIENLVLFNFLGTNSSANSVQRKNQR